LRIPNKYLVFLLIVGLLLNLFACTDTSRENPPAAETDENSVTVTASFRQEDGKVLCDSTIRIFLEKQSIDRTLDRNGETKVSGLPRTGSVALTVFDRKEQAQGAMSLSFNEGAVIDAVTDDSGNGHVTLKKDTEEVALTFLLKGDGTLQCALRLEETGLSSPSQGVI